MLDSVNRIKQARSQADLSGHSISTSPISTLTKLSRRSADHKCDAIPTKTKTIITKLNYYTWSELDQLTHKTSAHILQRVLTVRSVACIIELSRFTAAIVREMEKV